MNYRFMGNLKVIVDNVCNKLIASIFVTVISGDLILKVKCNKIKSSIAQSS